jgi:hypothetical protein
MFHKTCSGVLFCFIARCQNNALIVDIIDDFFWILLRFETLLTVGMVVAKNAHALLSLEQLTEPTVCSLQSESLLRIVLNLSCLRYSVK